MTGSYRRKPSEVARQLDVSLSTLRRWSTLFAQYLSKYAGDPDPAGGGGHTHRRYSDEDIAVLAIIQNLLANGQSYSQIEERLALMSDSEQDVTSYTEDQASILPAQVQTVSFLSNAIHSVVDGQQLLLNSQQANRDLMSMAVQDNFNLKEENARLRERMMKLEQELSENRRRDEARREMLDRRIERLEDMAYRLDALESPPETDSPQPKRGWLARLFGG